MYTYIYIYIYIVFAYPSQGHGLRRSESGVSVRKSWLAEKATGRGPKDPLLSLTERFITSCVSDAHLRRTPPMHTPMQRRHVCKGNRTRNQMITTTNKQRQQMVYRECRHTPARMGGGSSTGSTRMRRKQHSTRMCFAHRLARPAKQITQVCISLCIYIYIYVYVILCYSICTLHVIYYVYYNHSKRCVG